MFFMFFMFAKTGAEPGTGLEKGWSSMKSDRQLEQIVRGFSNHTRIAILRLLLREPRLSVADIAKKVRCQYQTGSEHVRKLHRAGLIHKRQPGPAQQHELTERGKATLQYLDAIH